VLTDMGAWHWENLALPVSVRMAPFRFTAPMEAPPVAAARFGPNGLEGKLSAGGFRDPGDAVLSPPGGRNLAVRLDPDGTFRTGPRDVLPAGEFQTGAVLSDRQQRRRDLYRELLDPAAPARAAPVLLAWADPTDMPFTLIGDGRKAGYALLAVPLRLERTGPGTKVVLPGPLVPFRQGVTGKRLRLRNPEDLGANFSLRFQLPEVVLPLEVERVQLTVKANAPGRKVSVAARSDGARGKAVPLHAVESPLDPVRVEITDRRFLRPDAEGALHFDLTVGNLAEGTKLKAKWTIEYVELEVEGRTAAEK
jgi:hypothetical protein